MLNSIKVEKPQRVFVYGTLKKGFGNHGFLKNSKYLGTDMVDDHTLVRGIGFPYMVEMKGGDVAGEVYEVNKATMEKLDMLEGYPSHYQKKEVEGILRGKMQAYYIDIESAPVAMLQTISLSIQKNGLLSSWGEGT